MPEKGKTGVALVYPYIQFRNVDWIKQALLYWDNLRRIVPSGYDFRDDADVSLLVSEGVVLNTVPADYVDRAAERVRQFCARAGEGPRALEVQNGQHEFMIHVEKFAPDLLDELRGSGLVEGQDEWLRTDPRFGASYMFCLATVMAEQIGADLTTDDWRFHNAGMFFTYADAEEVVRDGPRSGTLAELGLEWPTPSQLTDLPITKILKFREKHEAERHALRDAVHAITERLANVTDANKVTDMISNESKKIKLALRDQREAMRAAKIDTLTSVLDLKVPALLALTGQAVSVANADLGLLLTGSGIALVLANWYTTRRAARRQALRACPWHYMVDVKREFSR